MIITLEQLRYTPWKKNLKQVQFLWISILLVKTKLQATIQVFQTDNAKEYFHSILEKYLLENNIIHQSSCVDIPQQNGIVEKK